MPELPEVETVARDLRAAITGRRIEGVTVLRPDIVRYPDGTMLPALLTGQTFGEVERYGKYLFLGLDSGDDLMVHLGMTGHLLVCDADAPVPKHTHIRAALDDGRELRFDDARRFGRVAYGSREALIAARVFPKLGVEPLSVDFSQDRLDAVLQRTTRTVKAALLDQKGVAGLGNIYIDEACFLAGVRPTKRCNRLTKRERAALLAAIKRGAQQRCRKSGQQRRRLPRCMECARQQPGTPPGLRPRWAAVLSVRRRIAKHPESPAGPPCTARRCQR